MSNEVPRPEYPRPQFIRVDANGSPDWMCLNGEWEFSIDQGDSGLDRVLPAQPDWPMRIQVPFCPESRLSGIEHVDFMAAVWYRRTITLPTDWTGRTILLHFQAVDYDATVWAVKTTSDAAEVAAKMVEIGRHRGGFTPFSCDLSRVAEGGETVTIIVRARDNMAEAKPKGKQSSLYAPHGCHYTRTTGIWQTVWAEALPRPAALKRARITPDVAAGAFRIEQPLTNNPKGFRLRATARDAAGTVAETSVRADLDFAPRLDLPIPADRQRLWSPADPFLYDISVELLDAAGIVVDRVNSYAGLRSVSIEGKMVKINGESIYQRLVLDQGYYPDGVMTAPTDADLIKDIELSMAVGFNGARLHQKVFEERFLYHADRLGYLCWGEFADWGCGGHGPGHDHQQMSVTYPAQMLEALERDYSHPAIVGWCPLNETHQSLQDKITTLDDATRALFLACKAMDTTRPVLDTSGYSHRVYETDVYDSHDYIDEKVWDTGITNFSKREGEEGWTGFLNPHDNPLKWSVPYRGQPYFCSEYGGFKWVSEEKQEAGDSWGYGGAPKNLEDFYRRFAATTRILMDNPNMFAFCYTQLTDIFPEENGIYRFDRTSKFDPARLRAVLAPPAAIEQE
jgi:beta-galactosidase/beta-glucuronidase